MKLVISILGFGSVGKQICSSLMLSSKHELSINVIDVTDDVKGAFLDFQHANQLCPQHNLAYNSQYLFNQSDYIFHCAGATVPKGESRLGASSVNTIVTEKAFRHFNSVKKPKIIVVSNPVEIITFVTQKITGLPPQDVIGTGTFLDSIRMDFNIKQRFPNFNDIKAVLLGEHGSSVFIDRTHSIIDGKTIDEAIDKDNILSLLSEVKNAAHEIKKTQGVTIYGVSYCAIKLFEFLTEDDINYAPISVLTPDWLCEQIGCPPIYLSLYAQISNKGAIVSESHKPTPTELSKLKKSAHQLFEFIDKKYV